MTKKQNSIFVIALSILIALFILKMCDNTTMYDIYKNENLPKEIKGNIINIELYKGGNITLTIQEKRRKNIAINSSLKDIIRIGDFFEKTSSSNKCIISRNDSVYYFDCFKIPKEIRDSLGEIQEWPRDIVGKWTLK